MKSNFLIFLLLVTHFFVVSCNINSSQNQFDLAEELFLKEKYQAAIHELEKIVRREPTSELGIKSLYKIATIQRLYINAPVDALQTYNLLLKRVKREDDFKKIYRITAAMYFEKFADYKKAIESYGRLLRLDLEDEESEFFIYRIGRSFFMLSRFDLAIRTFTKLIKRYPNGKYSVRARFEIASTKSSQGQCKKAIPEYKSVIKIGREKERKLAVFGLASCYEELGALDRAYDLFNSIKNTYPIPVVVDLKMKKIKRRKILRRR